MMVDGLNTTQRDQLILAATFLDVCAGEGIEVSITTKGGRLLGLDSTDLVETISFAFGLRLGDERLPFREAVRNHLKGSDNG